MYKGIPNAVRGEVWCRVLDVTQIKQEQEGKYVVSFSILYILDFVIILLL